MTKLPTCDDETFASEVIARPGPVLVAFGAPWCAPCHAIEPALVELADAGTARVVKVDTDVSPTVSARFGVRAVPTLVVFVAGRPVAQLVGRQTRAAIERAVTDAMRA